MRAQSFKLALVATLVVPVIASSASAQGIVKELPGSYQPLNQLTPPGVTGYWSAATGRVEPNAFQPIRVILPTAGNVTFYEGPSAHPIPVTAPAKMGVAVGYTYRLKISDLPDYPGVELYPSVEVLDRLCASSTCAECQFAVPLEFTREEIEFAIRGRLVTKVIYLEQPQMAYFNDQTSRNGILDVPARRNLMAAADQAGRPMLLVRLGGRVPDPKTDDISFFATGAPLAPQQ
jgi:hypothetical protein